MLVVGLTYRLLRVSGAPTATALALCSVIAVLRTAAEMLLWAVQIALVGSLALFLGAVLVGCATTAHVILQVFGGEVATFHPAAYVATDMAPGVEHFVETAVGDGFLRLDFPPGVVQMCGEGRLRAHS